MVKKKREKLEIINDILSAIKGEGKIKPTRLLHSSNLSPQMFKEYIGLSIKRKLIDEVLIKKKKFFSLTNKGRDFLEKYRQIEKVIQYFGL
jgi:predicted transcriptional regulator